MSKKFFCNLSKSHALKEVWARPKQNGPLRGSDEELMLGFRNGDERSFEILYRRYEKPLFNFLYRMVVNAAEAESLCQEAFYRLVRAKTNYEPTARFKTWLYQIAVNLCQDRKRRMKHRSHRSLDSQVSSRQNEEAALQDFIPNPSADLEKQVETAELESFVKEEISRLPEEEKLVVILREYQGLKCSEIADIIGCPIGTVKSHNHRAHERLRKSLAKYLGD
ncbi:MAG: sigma-70 family RNA polymerase sigma factor [Candidatus Aminicenantes bacterium]|nr:MAG: sigma-70 family RNA polymerase sigma factor [Candidatus Aminicenantes bacterium]